MGPVLHGFDPPSVNPVTGATVDLDMADVEVKFTLPGLAAA
jgi:hypothetical protein